MAVVSSCRSRGLEYEPEDTAGVRLGHFNHRTDGTQRKIDARAWRGQTNDRRAPQAVIRVPLDVVFNHTASRLANIVLQLRGAGAGYYTAKTERTGTARVGNELEPKPQWPSVHRRS